MQRPSVDRLAPQTGVLADYQIKDLKILDPCVWHTSIDEAGNRVLSFGLSSYGYDIRLGHTLKILPSNTTDPVDPVNYVDHLVDFLPNNNGQYVVPPHGFVLGVSMEYFDMPKNVLALCLGKSTYARAALIVNVTPAEPGWCGYLTLELHNPTTRPIIIHPGQGICQMVFISGAEPRVTYASRAGKYQNQPNVPVGPKV